MDSLSLTLGAIPTKNNTCCKFKVWAANVDNLCLDIARQKGKSEIIAMQNIGNGYYVLELDDVAIGTNYYYWFNKLNRRPDPASRFQPEGVFGPSQVVSRTFTWTDQQWQGLKLEDYIIYELHVGLYTPQGTFTALIEHLDTLIDLGITAIEIMPIAQFSSQRNWGYDAVFPFAVQNTYGGPNALKNLINSCHAKGLAVILDVIYNHLGPEGNYFGDFAPYFTTKYKTPWGNGINFDDAYSDHVRLYFIENALHWMQEYHIDALRLDAVQEIHDNSAYHFLAQLADRVALLSKKSNKFLYLIAESNLNDIRLILPREQNGYGLDGQWNDDFHHALHSLVTAEKYDYYKDFGELNHLITAYNEGFVYSGQYSEFRKRNFGSSSKNILPQQFVVCTQNHDQVGNHYHGERLTKILNLQQMQLMAAAIIFSPYLPLIFMGEEYGETAPFNFFVSFIDKNLIAAVRKGRAAELTEIGLKYEMPDPQDEAVYNQSKLQHALKNQNSHKLLWEFYKKLLAIRKSSPVFKNKQRKDTVATGIHTQQIMIVVRTYQHQACLLLFNFNSTVSTITSGIPSGRWQLVLTNNVSTPHFPNEINENLTLEIPAYGFMLFNRMIGT